MTELNNYVHTEAIHNTNAAEAFVPILFDYISPKSVVDIGCGLGTWLRVFQNKGIKDILGIDGNYIDQSKLQINTSNFFLHDLTKPLNYHKKFDLAICLEVAEHLPEQSAETLIETLTALSDAILFSAALPLQGGQNHINEQSFCYWVKKFNKKGFIVRDVFRSRIWNNKNIDLWYRQNIFLVEKSDDIQEDIYDFYHPELYVHRMKNYQSLNEQIAKIYRGNITIKQSLKIMINSILEKIRKK